MTDPSLTLAAAAAQDPWAAYAMRAAMILVGSGLVILALAITGMRRLGVGRAFITLAIFVAAGIGLVKLATRLIKAIAL